MFYNTNPNKKSIFQNKEIIISSLFILASLSLALFFPVSHGSAVQPLTKGFFFLVVVPYFYIKIILKKNMADFGLNLNDKKGGLLYGFLMLVLVLAIVSLISKVSPAEKASIIPIYAQGNFWFFLIYEFIFVNILLFTYAFFWQGLVLGTYSEKCRYWAIVISLLLFIAFSIFNNDFFWKYYSLPIIILFSSISTYKTKSFVYSYASSLLFMILFDSYLIYSLNK